MKWNIHVFAGLADRMGGPVVQADWEQDCLTASEIITRLKDAYPDASGLIDVSFLAKNQAYAPPETVLEPSDEIALIPPVSGGQGQVEPALFQLTFEPIDTNEVANKVIHPNCGATLAFIGTTREYTQGKRTVLLHYDAYEPMALKTMEQIGAEISNTWPGTKCAITHRLGRVDIGETSVVIAVSSAHRDDCYSASRYAIERLKQIVPIWKKEIWEDGSEWKGHQTGPWNPVAAVPGGELS